MSFPELETLLAASALLLLGHFVRTLRWALLLPTDRVRRFSLLMGLALGYLVNTIVPYRIGEAVRAYYVSEREQVRFASVAATIAVERVTDLGVVGLIAGLLASTSRSFLTPIGPVAAGMLTITVLAVWGAVLVHRSSRVRRTVLAGASIFNDRVRFGIIDFVWSFSGLVRGGTVLHWRYLAGTVVMWVLYGASYRLFGHAAGQRLSDTLYFLLGSPLHSIIERVTSREPLQEDFLLLAFSALPLLGVVVYGLTRQRATIVRLLAATRRYGGVPGNRIPLLTQDRFKRESEYQYFLASLFSGDDRTAASFGLRATEDGLVHRLFNGGSDAVTALVEVDQKLVIRKFALGAPGVKLKAQAEWLRSHGGSGLPLVEIVGGREGNGFFRYDMPVVVPATDFYDVIHTTPIEHSTALLREVTDKVALFHEQMSSDPAERDIIARYLESKAIKNAAAIVDFARTMLPGDTYQINERRYDLEDWRHLLDLEWLKRQIEDPRTTVIHGDLTIENIIVAPNHRSGWYIIDPNPENLFDSPLLDWAKLMQSLHLGYEGLNRGVLCSLNEASIRLSFTRSHNYTALHDALERTIETRWGHNQLREVYFHELVHYLRLTPYKIRQDTLKGLTFFACTSLLLRRYLERYA